MILEDLELRDAVARKQLSVALVDISDLEHPKVASVNGDHMVYAASLAKMAILLGVFKQIEIGKMAWDMEGSAWLGTERRNVFYKSGSLNTDRTPLEEWFSRRTLPL